MAYSQRIARLSMLAPAAMVALALAVASPAVAFPIMYVFTGTGTGMVQEPSATRSFTNAAFEMSLISDTTWAYSWNGQIVNEGGGTVSISGLGSFNLISAQRVVVLNQSEVGLGYGPDTNGIFRLANLPSLAAMDYDLISVYPRETGLVTCCAGSLPGGGTIWTSPIWTDGGAISSSWQVIHFSAFGSTGTFEAIVEGVPEPPLGPLPEPGTLSLMALGFATVGVRRLRPLFQRRGALMRGPLRDRGADGTTSGTGPAR
jgi:hypothetical protein